MLTESLIVQFLDLSSVDYPLAEKISRATVEIARGILNGTIQSTIAEKRFGDADTLREYREGLSDLIEIAEGRGE